MCCHSDSKKFLTPLLAVVLIIFAVYLVGLSRNAWRNYNYIGKSPEYQDRIMVEGEGQVIAKPDVAVVNIGIISEGTTVNQAQKDSTEKMNAIIKAIKEEFKVADDDIKTDNYSINPKYDWSGRVQRIAGYTVNQSATIKARDFSKLGDLIARATALGANSVSGPQFTIDDPAVYRDEARKQAIARAKDKARVLADQVGVNLGRIVGFSEGNTVSYDNYYRKDMAVGAGSAEATTVAPAMEAGSQEVSVTVSISYEIK